MNTRNLIQSSLIAALLAAGAAAQAAPADNAGQVQPQALTFRQAQAASVHSVPRNMLAAYYDNQYPEHVPAANSGTQSARIRGAAVGLAPTADTSR